MRPGEQHINHDYRLRGECCRNGCEKPAVSRIRFFGYRSAQDKDTTYACAEHGRWWVTGLYGMLLGARGGITKWTT